MARSPDGGVPGHVGARRGRWAATPARRDLLLLAAALLVYALGRYVGLTRFPIYFFTDEAIGTDLGVELFRHGLRGAGGVLLPPYFDNDGKWSLGLSVYVQGLSATLFGMSVLVNRATAASVTLLAAVAIALTLRAVFRLRAWWAGPLALAALPAWFIHSRTSFETSMMVSFYACFLCAYLLYRYADPRALLAAIACGAATFYSYANGQGVMLVSGVLLLLSDLPYHLRVLRGRPRWLLAVPPALALAALPYLRFRLLHPGATTAHLRLMDSFWMRDLPPGEKLATFARQYLAGLSPAFWFAPDNGVDLIRHTLHGWGNFPLLLLPPIALGLGICLRRWRSSAHRAVLIAVLAAPFSAALVEVHNYRALAMVVPAALLACLGLDGATTWLTARGAPARPLALGGAALLVGLSVAILRFALVDGPTQYRDYGLYGMQYGAMQVFPAIGAELTAMPGTDVVLSPQWANNPNAFVPFFLPEAERDRVRFRSLAEYLAWRHEPEPGTLHVLLPDEYAAASASEKLEVSPPVRIVPYPDGRPGFYFVRLAYSERADALFAAERAARVALVEETITLDGRAVRVRHSPLNLGTLPMLFDGDRRTMIRGVEANPLVLEFTFDEPRTIGAVGLEFSSLDVQLTVTATPADGGPPHIYTAQYRGLPYEPRLDIALPDSPVAARTLRIEFLDLAGGERATIHVHTIQLR